MSEAAKQRADAAHAFNEPITVESAQLFQPADRPDTVKVALTTRFPPELLERIAAEAERRGTTPSDVIRDLVDRGLRALENSPVVTIRLADAHAALDAAIHNAA
ncbi:CopG family transcriptional regulator [Actinoplanes sp. NPDC049802]|uniref:ribbon-helix-helix domain-containing protein n=1 Tax=Actinoplanes sp. NPDC049802 TaxID=3154742 RepID=UPI0034048667